MEQEPSEIPTLQALGFGPAELEAVRAVASRVRRIATALFGAFACDSILFDGESAWFASGWKNVGSNRHPIAHLTRLQSEVVWIPEILADPRIPHRPEMREKGLRTYVGAAIRLESGERIGLLAVFLTRSEPYDAEKAGLLQDLADLISFECDRIRAAGERDAIIEQLRRSEQRLKTAAASADLFVYELDYERGVSIKIGDDLAFYPEPITYERCLEEDGYAVILPEDRQRVRDTWERHRTSGGPTDSEWRINRTDKEVWVHAYNEVFLDEQGKLVRRIGSLQNITERKKAEQALTEAKAAAEEANIAKSAFLATMSHEIRTPLNGVLGMAQAMAGEALSPVQRDRLDVIRQSGESLLAILNDTLDLAKIEAGRLELEEIEFDLGAIIRGCAAPYAELAGKKGLTFALHLEPGCGVYRGDPTRLRQVLNNLISNALKFTEKGEIRVTAGYAAGELSLTVADSGIGMSPATVAGLFSKFTQADASTTRRFGGTGLGLAICKQLVNLMGGAIHVTSREGEGSCFALKVPMIRFGDARPIVTTPLEPEPPERLNLRVLAAEDNSVNQLVLKTLLAQVGVEPVIVETGDLAVAAWESGDWDAILMDVQMPVMDGPTATRAIRSREAETGRARTPIIALTANAMSHQLAEYLASGMDDHVTKPIDAATLFAALEAAFEPDAAKADTRAA